MTSQRSKQFSAVTEQLNKGLTKALESFAQNTEWSDIPNWLANVESLLNQYPSPFIGDKVSLSKRLNQCMNPILPEKVHEAVIRIHQVIFTNMRKNVDGNINQYIRLFADDLGVYSISILPHFVHTSNFEQRLAILRLINHYYLDLGKELIPMLHGLLKALLQVYSATINGQLVQLIELTLSKILGAVGRRYVVGCTWSLILRFQNCRVSGFKFLARIIEKMQVIKGEQQLEESRGFSQLQQELMELERMETEALDNGQRHSMKRIIKHLQLERGPIEQDSNSMTFLSPEPMPSPIEAVNSPFALTQTKQEMLFNDTGKIIEEDFEESIEGGSRGSSKVKSLEKHSENPLPSQSESHKREEADRRPEKSLYHSQVPFATNLLRQEETIPLNAVPYMPSAGIQSIREGIDEPSLPENNFPHMGSLVISAIISTLEEEESVIRRSALDFLLSHLRIKSDKLGHQERGVLVEALLRLFYRKDISITKRVNRWLFGHEDEEGRFALNSKNDFVVDYIVEAFHHILEIIPTSEDNCTYPLKILQNFYIEHNALVQLTLSHISLQLLRYIFNFGSASTPSGGSDQGTQNTFEDVLKVGKRFLQNLPSYYVVVLRSLGHSFVQAVQKDDEDAAFEVAKYIDFCYVTLMKHEHGYEEVEYITVVIDYLSEGLSLVASSSNHHMSKIYLRDVVLLIYNLLERRRGVIKKNLREQEQINQKYFLQNNTEELSLDRLAFLEELQQKEKDEEQRYVSIHHKIELFFIELGYIVRNFANIRDYEETFKLSALAIVSLQAHLPKEPYSQLPRWFSALQGGIKVSNPLVSLAAIEALIRCLMWQSKHPIYASFKSVLMQEKAARQGTDYQKVALQKLWSLLDYPHMHGRIIDLIVTFSKYFPYEFAETVKRSFATNSVPEKQASIQRFSHFWRLTAFKYKDLLVNQEFAELNKAGLFRMLDFLDDQNPLVRHAAKSWLLESMGLLRRVIEPLLTELILGCTEWYQTPKGLLLIQSRYDTSLIFSTFRRIRAILSNGSYSFLRFVYQAEISEHLNQLREKITPISSRLLAVQNGVGVTVSQQVAAQRQPVLPRSMQRVVRKESRSSRLSYLDLLLILAVKYIEGHAIESMGIQFYLGNAGVNASAVELVETLLDYIDNPDLCQLVLNYLLERLFKVLGQVVLNREYIMQVQILNVLRNVFFNSSFRKKATGDKVRSFFKNIFTNQVFLKALLDALNTPFAYVRSQFIAFITISTPLIADFLEPPDCTLCVRHILYSYYKIIKGLGGSPTARAVAKQPTEQEKLPENLRRVAELKSRIRSQQNMVRFSDNLQQAGRANDMLSVLQGVESILNYFYDLDKVDPKQLNFEFSNPYTLFDTFKKIVTLGLASSSKKPKLVERKNFLHNFETCMALIKDLEPVYETILRAWPLSEEFLRIGAEEFSSVGMHSFNFERFSRYNKVVRDLITYVEEERESIWGKIYSIMQPLFCRFPKEIIDIYLKLWIRECSNIDETAKCIADPLRTELLMKIMQTIIVNNFPSNVVIHAFLESTAMQELSDYYSKNLNRRVLDFQIDKSESKLLYFLYVYFNYVYLNEKELTYEPLLEIWSLIMKALAPFQQSQTPNAAIWTLEIVNLCAKKYSPKELIKNQRFKTDLHALINNRLKNLAMIAAREEVYTFQEPLGKVSYDDSPIKTVQYHIVLPLPPTIYDLSRSAQSQLNETDRLCLAGYRAGEQKQIECRYRLYCFKVLKRLGLQVLQNTYLPQKMHFVVKRVDEWMTVIMRVIEDKTDANSIFAECASQVLFDLLDKARVLFLKQLREKVLAIFNKDDFFICSARTLSYWSKIIDWVVGLDKNAETYISYLQQVTLHSSYFTSQSTENKRRIKSFERVCFILYAGAKDRYAARLNVLLAKILEVIKKPESVHAALLILVLFALRILILRLSEVALNNLFTDIWPMILTLLMQTFSKKLVRVHIQNEVSHNPNFLLAALKLIEMISLNNLTEFAGHQWIFLADYFGCTYSVPELNSDFKEVFNKRPELASILTISPSSSPSPFLFKPALLNYLPPSGVSYLPSASSETLPYVAPNRIIVVRESFIRDESELRIYAILLMQYMSRLNEMRVSIDWKEVERVIVDDFINMDSFIHTID